MNARLPLVVAILSLAAATFAQELPHAFPRDGATRIFDNDRVTIWDVTWIHGKPSPMHRHKYDLVGVYLLGSPIRVTMPDGTSRDSKVDEGFVLFQPKGVTHIEEGLVDENPRHAILIDLKDAPSRSYPNATGLPSAFPREGAENRLENDRMAIWDYTWAEGRATPQHFHDRDVVVVFMEDGVLRSVTPDGKTSETEVHRGQASFTPGGRAHSEALVSGAPRAIIVELK